MPYGVRWGSPKSILGKSPNFKCTETGHIESPGSRGCFPNVNYQDSDFSDKERNIPSRAADIRRCSPKLELLLKKKNSEARVEGWVKKATMELVWTCQQLVRAVCQFVKAVMCRVSTY